MSYGGQLETAAGALARAHAALRDPPPDPAARSAAAIGRARLYRSLERQIVALGDVAAADLPPIGQRPAAHHPPPKRRRSAAALAMQLRYAAAGTISANVDERVDPQASGVVAVELREAYHALQAAGDILASHIGGHPGTAARHGPASSDGVALLAGVGRDDNLAALARLAAAAAAMDVRMTRWLWPEEAPPDLQPVLAAAELDAWQTRSGPLHETALLVAESGDGWQAPVLGMTTVPPIDDPLLWAQPTGLNDCIAAFDAARSWLTRTGHELTVGQIATTARAALAITHHVGYVHMRLAHVRDLSPVVTTAARPWRGVLQAVAELRSPVPPTGDDSTLSVATAGAAAWLGGQLRPDGQWRAPAAWAGDPAAADAWRVAAAQITARLPDLADLLAQASVAAHARGGILAVTGRLNPRSRNLVHGPHWQPVPADHHSWRAAQMALRNAAKSARQLAAVVRVSPLPGLAAARRRLGTRAVAAQLAGQWYPQRSGLAEPTPPAPVAARAGRAAGRPTKAARR